MPRAQQQGEEQGFFGSKNNLQLFAVEVIINVSKKSQNFRCPRKKATMTYLSSWHTLPVILRNWFLQKRKSCKKTRRCSQGLIFSTPLKMIILLKSRERCVRVEIHKKPSFDHEYFFPKKLWKVTSADGSGCAWQAKILHMQQQQRHHLQSPTFSKLKFPL